MITFAAGAVTGALILFLVLNNNPKLAAKLKGVADFVEKKVEEKTGKDI